MIGFNRICKVSIFAIPIMAIALIAVKATPGYAQPTIITNNTELLAIGIGPPNTPVQIYVSGGLSNPARDGATLEIQQTSAGDIDISDTSSNRGVLVGGVLLDNLGSPAAKPTALNNTILIEAAAGVAAADNIEG
ncbi:MAG: hypothetical protein LBF22_11720, partial [Deltaproteobacteria bacterium]|nr:hypothetical protein [Deltaproteobacteria bacterium]